MAKLIEVEKSWSETRYWYEIDGEKYAVCRDLDGGEAVLDSEGFPILPINLSRQVKTALSDAWPELF